MELRQYWNVIIRRKWLVLAIALLATLFSAFSFFTSTRQYKAETIFTVRQQNTPTDPTKIFTFNDYYNWIASEYLVDDYTQIVESDAFGQSVLDTIKKEVTAGNIVVSDTTKLLAEVDMMRPKNISDVVGAERRHRELRVFAETSNRDLTRAILEASSIVLTEGLMKFYRGENTDRPLIAQINTVTYDDMTSSVSKDITNALLRVILGLVAALAIAFLLEYLDNSVRDERDARKVLDLPVIGAIPRT
ncbi:MAG TPA: Wzz/FepE/Etk N-terminal domain-containing protein [Chloroflexia bacterium]|nr:Wzz/FepE/Etk N-terminal domain-containing protein [Chloroflexia bacterium]